MSAQNQPAGEASDHTGHATGTTPTAWKGAVAGIIGGLVGSLAIDGYLMGAAKLSQSGARALKKAREPAGLAAAKVIEKVSGQPLSEERIPVAGATTHYLFGASMGLTYGLAAEGTPSVTVGTGAAFGAGSSVVLDVVACRRWAFDEPPWETPPILHARDDRTRRVRCRHGGDTPVRPPVVGLAPKVRTWLRLRQSQAADRFPPLTAREFLI